MTDQELVTEAAKIAVAAERERCAKIAETHEKHVRDYSRDVFAKAIAEKIREQPAMKNPQRPPPPPNTTSAKGDKPVRPEPQARATFFLCQDNDAHWYLVDNAIRDQWFAWLDIPSDDVRSWKAPEGAERLSGPTSMIIFHLADETHN